MTKAGGSVVVDAFRSNVPGLIHVGGSVAAGCAAFLIWVAWVMGKKFDRLIETGDIVGGAAKVKFVVVVVVVVVVFVVAAAVVFFTRAVVQIHIPSTGPTHGAVYPRGVPVVTG